MLNRDIEQQPIEQNVEKNDDQIEKVLLNLKILAEIKEGDKLYLDEDERLMIDNSYIQCIQRPLYGQSRDRTIKFVKTLVNEAIDIVETTIKEELNGLNNGLNKYLKEDNLHLIQRFIKELGGSMKGLNNLKITYRTDTAASSSIDLILEKIGITLDKTNSQLHLFNNHSQL